MGGEGNPDEKLDWISWTLMASQAARSKYFPVIWINCCSNLVPMAFWSKGLAFGAIPMNEGIWDAGT